MCNDRSGLVGPCSLSLLIVFFISLTLTCVFVWFGGEGTHERGTREEEIYVEKKRRDTERVSPVVFFRCAALAG